MKVLCPACGAAVAPADINIAAMSAVCRACGEVFALPLGATAAIPQPPNDSERPRRVLVEDAGGGSLRLSWRWWQWQYAFLVFFTIAWDLFLVFWYSMALFGPVRSAPHHIEWMMVLFPICHVAVGVGLTYFLFAAILNRTVIVVDAYRLTARVGPVPWAGNMTLERERIHRLKVARQESRGRNGIQITHALIAELESSGQQVISKRFADREHALFVGRTIAAALRVPLIEE